MSLQDDGEVHSSPRHMRLAETTTEAAAIVEELTALRDRIADMSAVASESEGNAYGLVFRAHRDITRAIRRVLAVGHEVQVQIDKDMRREQRQK